MSSTDSFTSYELNHPAYLSSSAEYDKDSSKDSDSYSECSNDSQETYNSFPETFNESYDRDEKWIHQTWKTQKVPEHLQKQVDSWKELNPDYHYKLWDDRECLAFVQREYPQFLKTYLALPQPVMRADMFRYLVVYHYGGVYCDIDTWCCQPIDKWSCHPKKKLRVDWSKLNVCLELDCDEIPGISEYLYKRQYCQWAFCSSAKNPILLKVVEKIQRKMEKGFPLRTRVDLMLLTGPGIFTEVISKHKKSGWVKLLAKEAFAWNERSFGDCEYHHDDIYVLHTGEGSWKSSRRYPFIGVIILAIFLAIVMIGILYFFANSF